VDAVEIEPGRCATLRRLRDPALRVMRTHYEHPAFDFDALAAQRALRDIQGAGRTWYSGAWMGYGFHEDGMRSAVEVAEGLGVPW
jgi:predicted NAD/FAD-binding protein